MDLKSGRSIWLKNRPTPLRQSRLKTDELCDVIVIGAGITGALVAHQLVRSGLDVIVLDKSPVATASTAASTALLLYETDASLQQLAEAHGERTAHRVYRLGMEAILQIEHLIRTLKIDCGFQRKKTLYLASDRRGLQKLRVEYEIRRQIRLPARLLDRSSLLNDFGLDYPGALYSPGAAQLDPVKFTRSIFSHAIHHSNFRLLVAAEAAQIASLPRFARVQTKDGRVLSARYIVLATGYEETPFLEKGLVALHSTYVIASKPFPPGELWTDECLVWETARPYFYMRTSQDHSVLLGGEDEPFADAGSRDAKLPGKRRALQRRFHSLFPHFPFRTECAWTVMFGESTEVFHYI